jgi:hypothetical protein
VVRLEIAKVRVFNTHSFLLRRVLACLCFFINSAVNKSVDGWPVSLSELEKAKEQDVTVLLEQAKEFKTKAEARVSELVLEHPQCFFRPTHPQAEVEKYLPLDLPTASDRERFNARGIYIELKDVQRLLKEDPIDKERAARRIRVYVPYWVRNYKGACPESLSQLISRLEALAARLESTSAAEVPTDPVDDKAL